MSKHNQALADIKTHQSKYQVSYQTARVDLIKLSEKGLVTKILSGRKYVYVANTKAIKKLFKS